jgi:nucleoside phosphorylase
MSAAFETLRTGVGPIRAAQSLRRRLACGERPSIVVSSGFAGALTAGIDVGTWVTATRVAEWLNGMHVEVPEVVLREGPAPARRCKILSSEHIFGGWALLRSADDGSALAVDMESAALAREAGGRGITFMVLRLVSDTPERPLPSFLSPFAAAMATTDAESKLAHTARGLRGALADPHGVARIVREGIAWTRGLAQGWERFAGMIA